MCIPVRAMLAKRRAAFACLSSDVKSVNHCSAAVIRAESSASSFRLESEMSVCVCVCVCVCLQAQLNYH